MKSALTAARLKELLRYNPETGEFTWLVTRARGARAGDVAGNVTKNGVQIMIDGRNYKGHRLAWLYMTGEWPTLDIDHRDVDPTNNRWANLREATQSLNNGNTRRRADNTTGYKGVTRHQGRFRARIKQNGKNWNIGVYPTAEEAHRAYAEAASIVFGEFGRAA